MWVAHLDEKDQNSKVKRYVGQHVLFNAITDADIKESITKKVETFLSHVRSRWVQSRRSRHNFLTKNSEWLKGNVLDIETNSAARTSSKASIGKPFKELGEKQKKRRIQYLLDNYSHEELAHAAHLSLYASGQRDGSSIVKKVSENIPSTATAIKKAYSTPVSSPKRYSPEEALALFIQGRFTKYSYTIMQTGAKTRSAPIYPSYPLILEAKKQCYPTEDSIIITETSAEVRLQALLDHTSQRLVLYLKQVLQTYDISNELTLYCKWGCDGSSGHSNYKQRYVGNGEQQSGSEDDEENGNLQQQDPDNPSDSALYSICLVPLQLKTIGDGRIIWHNKKSSSPRFCRPIKIAFEKETALQTRREISTIEAQIEGLQPTVIYVGEENTTYRIHYDLKMTMVDGKTISAYTGKSVQTCNICGATPKLMNDLPSIFSRPKDTNQYNFGISSLHAYIRCLEMFLSISYRLQILKWRVYKTDKHDIEIFEKTKIKIQRQLREKTGLLVDFVKQGYGSSNDGNTAARFFEEYPLVAEITGLNEELLKRFNIILQAVSSGFTINVERFSAYTRETAELYVSLYNWYPMPASVHKLLIHAHAIIDSYSIAIGMMSEEALEARNKDLRRFRRENTRKISRKSTMEDLFHALLYSSDVYISSLAIEDDGALIHSSHKNKCFPDELLDLLSEPAEVTLIGSNRTNNLSELLEMEE